MLLLCQGAAAQSRNPVAPESCGDNHHLRRKHRMAESGQNLPFFSISSSYRSCPGQFLQTWSVRIDSGTINPKLFSQNLRSTLIFGPLARLWRKEDEQNPRRTPCRLARCSSVEDTRPSHLFCSCVSACIVNCGKLLLFIQPLLIYCLS